MAEVLMPKMGDGMEEGTINNWLKLEGDQVRSGEPIAEISTDKANVEITAYETGTLSKILVPVGGTVPVGAVIAHIGEVSTMKPNNGTAANNSAPTTSLPTVQSVPILPSVPMSSQSDARIKSSPLARRMASELGIELAKVTGTSVGGRIVARDIEAYLKSAPLPEVPVFTKMPEVMPVSTVASYTEIKPTRMREAIAKRTVQSKQQAPHFFVSMVIEMDRAQALLKELNADGESKITVNDIIVKACAVALERVPEVNSSWTAEGMLRRYSVAHIGIAVGIEDGLIIPVVRDCHTKTLRQISADAKTMIGKARKGQLTLDEYSGGTFSVSNLGMMGVDEFIAIINPPEAAILAIGGIFREPVVLENEDIAIRSRMKVTLSADHRLLDGVSAAKFLQEVKKSLEAPFSLLS